MNLLKDFNGALFSSDLILSFILLILVLGSIINLMGDSRYNNEFISSIQFKKN